MKLKQMAGLLPIMTASIVTVGCASQTTGAPTAQEQHPVQVTTAPEQDMPASDAVQDLFDGVDESSAALAQTFEQVCDGALAVDANGHSDDIYYFVCPVEGSEVMLSINRQGPDAYWIGDVFYERCPEASSERPTVIVGGGWMISNYQLTPLPERVSQAFAGFEKRDCTPELLQSWTN
jgi:hypothetical protein